MPNDAVIAFVRRLLRATQEGTLKWESDTPGGPFMAKSGSGSVLVGGGDVATVFTVRDSKEQVIETLATEPQRPGAWLPWEEALQALWGEARLSALGTTEVIKDLSE